MIALSTMVNTTATSVQHTNGNDLIGIGSLTADRINSLLIEAQNMKRRLQQLQAGFNPEHVFDGPPPLHGRRIVTLFFENSTRTINSFHAAITYLGGTPFDLAVARSSVTKGERLDDTLSTIKATGAEAVIIRHHVTGAAHFAAQQLDIPVINAGDGTGEHPTQALLDAMTILERKGRISGLKVAIIGDIVHSRVARSNTLLLRTLGADVWLSGPAAALPSAIAWPGVTVTTDLVAALRDADVVMALRVQRERHGHSPLPGPGEYRRHYGLDAGRLSLCRSDVTLLHPGPVNRGIELDGELLNDPRSAIDQQVYNAVPTRMAVLVAAVVGGGLKL